MAQALSDDTRRILTSPVGMTAEIESEFADIIAKAWQAFHSKALLWRSRRSIGGKFEGSAFVRLRVFLLAARAIGRQESSSKCRRCNAR